MDNPYREKQRKSYIRMRTIYDFTMSILILSMAVVMFFGPQLKIGFVEDLDKLIRYGFGGLCALYGAYRMYLVFKQNY